MKTKVFGLVVMFLMGTFTVFAGKKTEKIQVNGNCGMCKTRIEKAASSVEGVSKADWNKDTKILAVVFDDSKTSTAKIEMAVANVGHDTPNHKAKDEVYNKLHSCCKYDRTEAGKDKKGHESHNH